MRTWARRLGLLVAVTVGGEASSLAYFLDSNRNFDVRLRAYSQLEIMTNDAPTTNDPTRAGWPGGAAAYHVGDLASQRNFYNPEFDAKLTDYLRGMNEVPGLSLVTPDELKFHFAWWGFYDGLYDYMDPVWNRNRENLKGRFSESDDIGRETFGFNDENNNARHIYGRRNRINELYLDYTVGRFFFRVGRQAISWGESDDIALLDVQNPYDLTQGAPGFFQDIEEARIPLWTFRSTIKLVDNWNWLSSFFLDSYLVPGPIDTTVPIDPILGGVSPWSPNQTDPQSQIPAAQRAAIHQVTVSKLPENTWNNSRWGVRLTGVLFRDYTVQGWFYRTFNEAPSPLILGPPGAVDLGAAGLSTLVDDRGFRVPVCLDPNTGKPLKKPTGLAFALESFGVTPGGRPCSWAAPSVTVLERRLESVVGLSGSWFSPTLNGVVRLEGEYFNHELASIPTVNLNPRVQLPAQFNPGQKPNRLPTADYLRWVIGYDRFFFFRPLNPSNSFTWVSALHGQWTISQRENQDYRQPSPKPGHPATRTGPQSGCPAKYLNNPTLRQLCIFVNPKDFVDAYEVDNVFLQSTLLTDYMHGRLHPQFTAIIDVTGVFALNPSLTYRINDNLLAGIQYFSIQATRPNYQLATFVGHDMVQFRLTYQLN
jgi:hypothetical protein